MYMSYRPGPVLRQFIKLINRYYNINNWPMICNFAKVAASQSTCVLATTGLISYQMLFLFKTLSQKYVKAYDLKQW